MALLPIQTQSFLLYGNGVVIGNTSVILSSFLDINGNAISMQGTVMTGTVEPNGGVNEEQIIFTGVTQNSNGTATLTGVSSVAFASPYTQTSGFVKNHAGNTTFVLSDTAYLYSQFANLGNNNIFTGTNTFNISPIIPTVSSAQTTQAASVGYVNSVAIAGAPLASNTVIGITELSVAPSNASMPIAVGTNDTRVPTASEALALAGDNGTPSSLNTYVTQSGFQNGSEDFAIATGSSTAYAIALSPTPAGYVKGERIYVQANVASGTLPTLNKNSLGAKSIYKWTSTGSTPLAVGDWGTNQMNVLEYDGAAYQQLSPTANVGGVQSFVGALTTTSSASSQAINSVFTTTFTPTVITLYYNINGLNSSSVFSKGVAVYAGSTLKINHSDYLSQTSAVNLTPALTNDTSTAPTAGVTGGTNDQTVLTITSVSATGFTVVSTFTNGSGGSRSANFTAVATA